MKPSTLLLAMLLAPFCTSLTACANRISDTTAAGNAQTDALPRVEASVGSHRLRIPAHYFENQMGPEHDGSFSVYLELPGLQPFAPGARRPISLDILARQVAITYSQVSSGIETLQERTIGPLFPEDRQAWDDPTLNLELRIKGAERYGLTPYYTDFDKVTAYARQKYGSSTANAVLKDSPANNDVFVKRTADGKISTSIKCTSREVEGEAITYSGGAITRKKQFDGFPSCDQLTIIPGSDIAVRMNYARAFLEDWQSIEAHAIVIISQYEIDKEEHNQ